MTPKIAGWDVFISYSSKDAEAAEKIHAALEEKGVRVFRDKTGIHGADNIPVSIQNAIETSRSVALLISPDALESPWVEAEWTAAFMKANEKESSLRLIPVLVRDAPLPLLLASSKVIDFRPLVSFEDRIGDLERAIRGVAVPPAALPEFPSELAFLGFFPEGLLTPVYQGLVAIQGLDRSARQAEEAGIVRPIEVHGVDMIGLDPQYILTATNSIVNEKETARQLLTMVESCFAEEDPFSDLFQVLGRGRAILLRDLLALAERSDETTEEGQKLRDRWCAHARALLPMIVAENQLRIGMEISVKLLELSSTLPVRDRLTHAALLLRLGHAEKAMESLEAFRGDQLFDDAGLTVFERIEAALDWAKAIKDAGRAGIMHGDLIAAYQQMLGLMDSLPSEASREKLRLKADLFHNRATQLAVFGSEDDWLRAQADLEIAAGLYDELGDPRSSATARANVVAHALRRVPMGEVPPPELLRLLEGVDEIPDWPPDEDLFFVLYQRAKLLRCSRLLHEAEAAYETAANVAEQAQLSHRAALAKLGLMRLRESADKIASEDAYLGELRSLAGRLAEHSEDAWSTNALRDLLVEIGLKLRNRGQVEEAWQSLKQAFAIEAGKYLRNGASGSEAAFRPILAPLAEIEPGGSQKDAFLQANAQLINRLLKKPSYVVPKWNDVQGWLRSKGMVP